MNLYILVTISLIAAACSFVFAVKILAKKGWLKGFARGALGFSLLLLTWILAISSIDLMNFIPLSSQSDAIATVSFKKLSPQLFSVKIKKVDNSDEMILTLSGDSIQMGVEQLTLPFSSDYDLFQLSFVKTKYYSIEQQESQNVSNFSLKKDSYTISLWDIAAISGRYGILKSMETPFYAMSEGELLSLTVFNGRVLLEPMR